MQVSWDCEYSHGVFTPIIFHYLPFNHNYTIRSRLQYDFQTNTSIYQCRRCRKIVSYNNQIIHKFITTRQATWTVIQNVKQSQTSPLCLIVHFGTLLTNYYEMIAEPNAKNVTATPLHTEQSSKAWCLKKMCGSFTPELTTTIHTINKDHQ